MIAKLGARKIDEWASMQHTYNGSAMRLGRLRIAAVLVAGLATAPAMGRAQAPSVEVVQVARRGDGAAAASGAPALRSQSIDVSETGVKLLRAGTRVEFDFHLFTDTRLTAQVERLNLLNAESFTATGRLGDGGWFVLARVDQAIAANFWTAAGKRFEIRPSGNGEHWVAELDPLGFEPCAAGVELAMNESDEREAASGVSCSNVIDVLIVYTELARTTAGGEAAIRAIAHASVASANLMYDNSGVDAMLRLVHVQEVPYQETGILQTDLERLRLPSDGHMDEVHALRNEYGGDLVSLLIGSVSGTCGTAYVMTNPSPAFANLAFSVVRHVCAVGDMTFAHEVGHNLGCQHQHNQPGNGAFPYSFGHPFVGASGAAWRTVMAITPGRRIPFFSNPDVLYDGVATGVPLDQPDPAHCALAISTTSTIAGGFRASVAHDCNRNGLDDACDLASGSSEDANANGIPDECDGPSCAADVMLAVAPQDSLSTDQFGMSVALGGDRFIAGADFNDEAGQNAGAAYVFRRIVGEQPASMVDGWILESKLIGFDSGPFEHFGNAVALTHDDEWAIVGAFRDTTAISDVGAAYIFKREGTLWVEQAKLVAPTPAQQDWLGSSVALFASSQGELFALVGAPQDDEAASNAGAVHAYANVAGAWSHQGILIADDARPNDRFGAAVGAASDRLIIGAPLADHSGDQSGAVYVFRLEAGAWVQEALLLGPDGAAGDQFGHAVAIDGDRVVIGSPRSDDEGTDSGAVYVFVRKDEAWALEAKLKPADFAAEDRFGWSVSMSGDRIMAGSPQDSHLGSATGSAYLFVLGPEGWHQWAKLTAADGSPHDQFGASVSIGASPDRAVVGAPLTDRPTAIDGGMAHVVELQGKQPDCNGNSFADDCDIASGLSADENRNGVPDECELPDCPGDIVGNDHVVDVLDLLAVINSWGECSAPCPIIVCPEDVDGDCQVGASDLREVIQHWGECPQR